MAAKAPVVDPVDDNPVDTTLETSTDTVEEQSTDATQQTTDVQEKTPEQKEADRRAYAERKLKEDAENLRKELEGYKRRDEEAKLKAEEDRKAQLTEEQRIKEERDRFAQEIDQYKMDSLRERIGREYNLRDEMIPRLIGTDEASLKADAADLVAKGFTKTRVRVGNTTNPSAEQGAPGRKYTRTEIADPAFFRSNEKDIMAAMSEGRIVN